MEALFYKSKWNSYGFFVVKEGKGRNISYISNKRRYTTSNSHFNSSEYNNINTSKRENVVENSELPHINAQRKSSLNKLSTLQKETDTESSISINDEITWENNISETISDHKILAEVIINTCDDNGHSLLNK